MPSRLVVNGAPREYGNGGPATLFELIELMDLRDARIVAELNGKVIKRDLFHVQPLVDGDNVELVKFMGGG